MRNYRTEWYSLGNVCVFRTRSFSRWMRTAGLTDETLCRAVVEMIRGLIDADLGGHVVKKRIALAGQGKRGGVRTIVASNLADRWFFLYGFGKNERANVDDSELRMLREVAKELLEFNDEQRVAALVAGEIVEICRDNDQA